MQAGRRQRLRILPGQQGGRTVEVYDIDSDCSSQARSRPLTVDDGDKIVHRHLQAARNVVQRIPHDRFEPNARSVTRNDDIANHE